MPSGLVRRGQGSGGPAGVRAGLPLLRSGERAEAHFPEFGALMEAAHAEPVLRQLCVFSSHWTLGFSSCSGYPLRVEVAVAPSNSGSPYRVQEELWAEALGETATAEEADSRSRLPTGPKMPPETAQGPDPNCGSGP